MTKVRTPEEVFSSALDRVCTLGVCWEWTGRLSDKGYGVVWVDGAWVGAHKYIYEYLVGKVDDGLVLDHLCRNRKCVNPDHLEPVTVEENNLRGYGIMAVNARKDKCNCGREFKLRKRPNNKFSRYCSYCNDTRRKNAQGCPSLSDS